MRKVLVTGASGFLGRHLINELLKSEDIQLIAILGPSGAGHHAFPENPRLQLFPTDALFCEPFVGIDTVVNCAFPRSNDAKVLADAIDFTERLIHQLETLDSKSIINVSSQGVYQRLEAGYLSSESSPIKPVDMYSMVKFAIEKMFNLSSLRYVTNLRLASLMMPKRFLHFFVSKAKAGQRFTVTAPNQYVALLDVIDAARGLAAVVDLPHQKRAKVYNLGINTHYSLLDYAESVKSIGSGLGYSADFEVSDNGSDVCAGMDCSRLMADTGWKPLILKDDMITNLFKEL